MENNTNGGEKYYTPNISEFHVGFEYEEYIDGRNKFIKKTIESTDLIVLFGDETIFDCIIENLSLSKIRVKYLDKEDIESLGFVCTRSNSDGFEFQNIIDDYSFYDIDFYPENMSVLVEYYYQREITADVTGNKNCKTLFYGNIKNKSELKRLLVQLGVTEASQPSK